MKSASAAAAIVIMVVLAGIGYMNGPKVAKASQPFSPNALHFDSAAMKTGAWQAY